jgi:hypothetical protein
VEVLTPEGNLSTYTFNKHVIKHHFRTRCGYRNDLAKAGGTIENAVKKYMSDRASSIITNAVRAVGELNLVQLLSPKPNKHKLTPVGSRDKRGVQCLSQWAR